MDINFEKLKAMINVHAEPRWNDSNAKDAWGFRKGGGETYHHEKVLLRAEPELTQKSLQENARASVLNALKYNKNLLSVFETLYAKLFVEHASENDLRTNMIEFLYGGEKLEDRLRAFLTWAKVKPIPGESKKIGFSPQVASYFLAMSDPRKYAFCKPKAYNAAVNELIGNHARAKNPIDRILHCRGFYTQILNVLEKEYGLEDGNLLDVHSLLYLFKSLGWDTSATEKETAMPVDNTIYTLLMEKHNIVFYGPPGTGKTREALEFAKLWEKNSGPESVDQITFHPSYCYEDFIEGFRPTPDGEKFILKDGIFKTICKKAIQNSKKNFLLIIDEINRGDVARILGELITILEGDKRGEDFATILQQSGEKFYVPENIYIVGTMNTADKSISLMDIAIRRRFLFIHCLPDPDLLDEGKEFCDSIEGVSLSMLLVNINQRLMNAGIDRDRILGHSYFLIRKDSQSPLDILINRIRYELIPIVEEYCYSDRTLMSSVLGNLVDDSGIINNDVLDDTDSFIEALKAIEGA